MLMQMQGGGIKLECVVRAAGVVKPNAKQGYLRYFCLRFSCAYFQRKIFFFFQATANASAAGSEDAINPDGEVQLFSA